MANTIPFGYNVQARQPIDSRFVFAGRPWLNQRIVVNNNSANHIAYEGLIAVDTSMTGGSTPAPGSSIWYLTDINEVGNFAGWTEISVEGPMGLMGADGDDGASLSVSVSMPTGTPPMRTVTIVSTDTTVADVTFVIADGAVGAAGAPGIDGAQGPAGPFTIDVFVRDLVSPLVAPTVTSFSYDAATGIVTLVGLTSTEGGFEGTNWQDEIPVGTEPLHESRAIFNPGGNDGAGTLGVFSVPFIAGSAGPSGQPGAQGPMGLMGANGVGFRLDPNAAEGSQTRTSFHNDAQVGDTFVNNGINSGAIFRVTAIDATDITFSAQLGSLQGADGAAGRGIVSITGPQTAGLVDTYTIVYTSGPTSTFTVRNSSITEVNSGDAGTQPLSTITVDGVTYFITASGVSPLATLNMHAGLFPSAGPTSAAHLNQFNDSTEIVPASRAIEADTQGDGFTGNNFIWIVYDPLVVLNGVSSGGISIPLNAAESRTIGGVAYMIRRSTNMYYDTGTGSISLNNIVIG